jgi:hypothetical protein
MTEQVVQCADCGETIDPETEHTVAVRESGPGEYQRYHASCYGEVTN